MNLLKKSVKSMVALGLCLCTVLSVSAFRVSAEKTKEIEKYVTPIKDCEVTVSATEGGKVTCTGATDGFLMESGVSKYIVYT